jgi:DNA-directed RNA polymerase specialized sigma24 family protein
VEETEETMKTPLEDLIDATMQEHERRLRLRERDILDCLYERQREVWVLTAIGGLNAATIAARINAREGAGTITEGAVRAHYRNAQRQLRRMLLQQG